MKILNLLSNECNEHNLTKICFPEIIEDDVAYLKQTLSKPGRKEYTYTTDINESEYFIDEIYIHQIPELYNLNYNIIKFNEIYTKCYCVLKEQNNNITSFTRYKPIGYSFENTTSIITPDPTKAKDFFLTLKHNFIYSLQNQIMNVAQIEFKY